MKIPENPKKGYEIAAWCESLVKYLRGERIVAVRGGRLVDSSNGKTLIIDNQGNTDQRGRSTLLPFELTYSTGLASLAPGSIGGDTFPTPTTQAIGTSGSETWYAYAKVEFDTADGTVTDTSVVWSTTGLVTDADSGVAYGELAFAVFTDGVMDVDQSVNMNFGPIFFFIVGGIDSKWEAFVY